MTDYTVKQVLDLATKYIYPSRQGNHWVIISPYYGLGKCDGPRLAPASSHHWSRIQDIVRLNRISDSVELLTGDADYASQIAYTDQADYWPRPDWRKIVRKAAREYKQKRGQQ